MLTPIAGIADARVNRNGYGPLGLDVHASGSIGASRPSKGAFMRKVALALALPFIALLDVVFVSRHHQAAVVLSGGKYCDASCTAWKALSAPYFWLGIVILWIAIFSHGTWWQGPRWLLGAALRISLGLPLWPILSLWLWWITRKLFVPLIGNELWSMIGPAVWFIIVFIPIFWWPLVRGPTGQKGE
jgi:hypothetical protein